jgi:N-acetylglucosamine kinase-like BadF-type ATPase
MAYFMGIDAGGTKTHCLIGDGEGHVLGFGKAGPGNYEVAGVPAAAQQIEAAVLDALREAEVELDQIAAIGMGIAGADLPEDYVMLDRELFIPLFGAIPRVFRNDSMAGLRGGLREPSGIVIACGTGCVCAGINRRGEETRVGGLSEDFGDMVSGSEIGKEGLKAVWRARDGIRPPTLLTEKFVRRSGQPDLEAFFHAVYRNEIKIDDLQPMAPMVFDAASEGDATAADILETSGRYLGEMVNAVARHLHMTQESFDVVMAGSVFKGSSPILRDAMTTQIHRECPQAAMVLARFEPVVGALLMGIEFNGTISDAAYNALAESLSEAEQRFGIRFRTE